MAILIALSLISIAYYYSINESEVHHLPYDAVEIRFSEEIDNNIFAIGIVQENYSSVFTWDKNTNATETYLKYTSANLNESIAFQILNEQGISAKTNDSFVPTNITYVNEGEYHFTYYDGWVMIEEGYWSYGGGIMYLSNQTILYTF